MEIPSEFNQFQGFNKPEASKHKRKEVGNLDASTLDAYSNSLNKLLLQPFFDLKRWKAMRGAVTSLVECTTKYALYLRKKCDSIKTHHAALQPVRSASDHESFCLISEAVWVEPATAMKYRSLQECLDSAKEFQPLLLNDFVPVNARYVKILVLSSLTLLSCRQRRTYVDHLKCSPTLTCDVMMYNYATGNRVGTLHFVWKIPKDVSKKEATLVHYTKLNPLFQCSTHELCAGSSLKR